MEEKNDSVIIEIPEDLKQWSKCMIYRVPRKLRKENEAIFTPQLVSIGPFHHGRSELKGMESHKEKYLGEFCKRTDKTREDLGNFVSDHSTEILAAYAGTIEELPLQVFDQMILRDSCFILELLCLFAEKRCQDQDDYILRTTWLRNAIKLDLILFENQIPFSFLKKLYAFAEPRHENIIGSSRVQTVPYPHSEECCSININSCIHFIKGFLSCKFSHCVSCQKNPEEDNSSRRSISTDNDDHTLLEISYNFFANISSGIDEGKKVDTKEVKHFTDLFRNFWLSRDFINGRKRSCPFKHEKYLYSATKLSKAGVKFVPSAEEQASLVDFDIIERPLFNFIPFLHTLKVELTPFEIECNTETLMRNVIALEQCLYPDKAYICNYVALMSQLVDTVEDIEFLVEKRIIKNMLGSNKEVAELVNRLTYKITESNFVYAIKCRQLNKFYETRFNVVRATLKRVYFNDLWTGSSTVLGLCILFFSVSSTIKTLFFSQH